MSARQGADYDATISDRRPLSWRGTLFCVLVTIAVLPILGVIVAGSLAWLVHLWNLSLWLLVLIGSILTAGGVVAVWFWMRALSRRRYQFSIRSMLIGMAVVALILGVIGRRFHQAWRQQRAVSDFVGNGGGVKAWWETENPNLLNTKFGHDPFTKVLEVRIRGDGAVAALLEHPREFADLEHLLFSGGITDSGLECVGSLNDLPRLHTASILGTTITGAGLKHLGQWTNLKELCLNGCSQVTDDGLAHLENLPNLDYLMLVVEGKETMPLSDAGLVHLGKMSQLRTLAIIGVPVSDAGLMHLGKMSQLKTLVISRLAVSDAGLMHLRSMTNLRGLAILRCTVTDDGIKQLCEALPNCWVKKEGECFPSAEQIVRISVTDVRGLKRPVITISDPDRIAVIKGIFEETCLDPHWKGLADTPSGANVRVNFEGPNRSFCQVLLGEGLLQLKVDHRWNHQTISDYDTTRLADALGLSAEE